MSRGMFGYDLPPGVSLSDIPGNRPEDVEWERIYENFFDEKRLANANGTRISKKQNEQMEKLYSDPKVSGTIDQYIIAAIEYGMDVANKQSTEEAKENKQYNHYYHEEFRNPYLRDFFKSNRNLIRILKETITRLEKEVSS